MLNDLKNIHKPMLGLIGLIIANQSSLQRKITMQEKHLCWLPLHISLSSQCRPSRFFIRESPLLAKRVGRNFKMGTNSTGVGAYHSLTPHNLNGRFGVLEDPLFCKRKYINLLSPINQCCIEFEASSVKHALVS